MGLGMAIYVLMVAMYAFAWDWTWVLVAMILSPITMALLFWSQNIMIVNGLARRVVWAPAQYMSSCSLRMALIFLAACWTSSSLLPPVITIFPLEKSKNTTFGSDIL